MELHILIEKQKSVNNNKYRDRNFSNDWKELIARDELLAVTSNLNFIFLLLDFSKTFISLVGMSKIYRGVCFEVGVVQTNTAIFSTRCEALIATVQRVDTSLEKKKKVNQNK